MTIMKKPSYKLPEAVRFWGQ